MEHALFSHPHFREDEAVGLLLSACKSAELTDIHSSFKDDFSMDFQPF
jgi:hypothetical protein